MKINTRLKQLRLSAGLSQEAIATTGICSTPGWIKMENGQREPSEKLLVKLVTFLVINKHIPKNKTKSLTEELLTLKYMSVKSPFVRELAIAHAKTLPDADRLLAPDPTTKTKRGRPMAVKKPKRVSKPAADYRSQKSPLQQPT